jgi:hypothetical protein
LLPSYHTLLTILLDFFFFPFFSTRNQTQVLVHARQALH